MLCVNWKDQDSNKGSQQALFFFYLIVFSTEFLTEEDIEMLELYKILPNDDILLENEINNVLNTNHLLPFNVYILRGDKYVIGLTPLVKNSINYRYFTHSFKVVNKAAFRIISRNIKGEVL